ncbi:MAG: DMT family transporter [Rhodospirillales bacterium]|jgi:drug/metabolite transporter (DMT)-like permease|nr:EamA family transporter [Rhodospirillaceae bacterium]MDP6426383.1 DMT family transporter [Rhodospirillales bacterium]MDP6642707.1 DMT family transporter [Rhodospirillales bacterium]|tara:strand:+ start:143 stop:1042 length:900 start_codon:yes stop_codon:yes gene_type:complete
MIKATRLGAIPASRFSPIVIASLWMTATLLSFAAMAIAGRELSDTMSTFEILFFRALVATLIVLALIPRQGIAALRTRHISLHFLRNTIHFGAQYGWFLGISLLPLATVFSLEFTTPIWGALLAVLFLGEKLNRGRVIAIVFGFGGVLIILRPGGEAIDIASLAVLGAAFGYAVSYITTKKLSAFDTPFAVIFYMNLIQLPLGLVPALSGWVAPTVADIPWILLVGVTGLAAHYSMTRAFRLADATLILPIDFLRLPLIAVVGFFFYAEAVDLALFAGAIIIFGGNYYNIQLEARRAGD